MRKEDIAINLNDLIFIHNVNDWSDESIAIKHKPTGIKIEFSKEEISETGYVIEKFREAIFAKVDYAPPVDANPKPLEDQVKEILRIALHKPDTDPPVITHFELRGSNKEKERCHGAFVISTKYEPIEFQISRTYVLLSTPEKRDPKKSNLLILHRAMFIYNLPQLVEKLAQLNFK